MTMKTYTRHGGTKTTPQSEPIPGKPQVKNNAGGFVFAVDDWKRLDRFLILGSEGGTFYQGERALTKENAEAVIRCVQLDGARAIARIVEVSDRGLAPKNDPAIFALAAASSLGDQQTRHKAFEALPAVCRIGTHLFAFAEARQAFGGWGRGMRRAVRDWYLKKDADTLALQLAKYQQRNGWSHKDLLRLSHPKSADEQVNALLGWAVGKAHSTAPGHALISAATEAMAEDTTKSRVVQLIAEQNLTREMIATNHLSDSDVQWALMQKQPMVALVRNLGNYSKSGLLKALSKAEQFVVERLSDREALRKARIHPFAVLLAARTYATGHGARGSGQWDVCSRVVDALDDTFYASFENVEPTSKRYLLALDVSGSMDSPIGNTVLSCREAAAAMAMTTARTEPVHQMVGFANGGRGFGGQWGGAPSKLTPVNISARSRLADACKAMSAIPMGGTDCALPMVHATENQLDVDVFVIYTDNETWAGRIHPKQALDQYRQKCGRDARLAVCAFTSSGFSIADPEDAGMLDCVGLDASLPQVLRSFALGEV